MSRAAAWGVALAVVAATLGCRSSTAPAPSASGVVGSSASAARPAPPAEAQDLLARRLVSEALEATRRLAARPSEPCGYTEEDWRLRRAIAAGKALWRLSSVQGVEVLLGPARSTAEAGGMLTLYDRALEGRQCAPAREALRDISRALQLIEVELAVGVPRRETARAASLMAYELGLVLAGASAELASSELGVRADALGTLDGLEGVMTALERSGSGAAPARWRAVHAQLSQAVEAGTEAGLRGRARLVVQTGQLGVAVRAALRGAGYHVPPPYAPRVAAGSDAEREPISALTVPASKAPPTRSQVALGRRLFFEQRLSGSGQRSCASCHQPERAFTDGLAVPASLDPTTPLTRNTPTLLYALPQAVFLWDGGLATAASQALRVLHNQAEMGITAAELEERISRDPEYRRAFEEAFPEGVTTVNVGRALSAYQDAELVPANAPIDHLARGDQSALTERELAGFDVFAGAGRCARCHVPPLFGGTRPPDFSSAVFGVLGTPTRPKGKQLSPDPGRQAFTHDALDRGAFKTPNLREIARTPPYFHNGAYATLEQVVDFYDEGGGAALGLPVEHQDPDVRPLELTPEQRRELLAFLRRPLSELPASRARP